MGVMKRTHSFLPILVALSFSSAAQGATIANWKVFGSYPITGATTDSPSIGDGTTTNSAQGAVFAGRFGTAAAPVTATLAVGQTLTVTGNMVLTGGSNTASDFRFGVFNDGGKFAANSSANWTGGWVHQPGSDLYQARTDGTFISTAGNAVAIGATKTSTGTFDGDSLAPFTFSLSITRNSATTVGLSSTFIGGDGILNQAYSVANRTTTNFDYTAVGFLYGGGSELEQGSLSNVQFNVIPEPTLPALALISLAGLFLRRRR